MLLSKTILITEIYGPPALAGEEHSGRFVDTLSQKIHEPHRLGQL
jgi:hypothetical protein